ncbi:MAG TPA: response regulator [Nitrospira sp.]|nr:response regulator [Nitrospira sp.]
MASTIFVIDSSPAVRRMVEQISTPEGYEVVGFHDGPAALDAARKLSPRLIIADYHLESMTFSGFCKEVHKIDCLSETYIISLVGAGDRLDESHLRSLGVKAFLKKPFQTDHLLDLIKDLDHTATGQTNGSKKRSWPPVSSATDSDDDGLDESGDEDQTGEIEAEVIPSSVRMDTTASQAPKQPTNDPEDAMKGLFAQLLQTMSEKAEQKIADALPKMVSRDLATQVAQAVEAEMNRQFSATLTQERLTQTIEPLLAKELPRVLSRELPEFEPILRHSIVDIAGPLVKEHVDHVIREQAEAIKTAVPEAVREHLKSIEEQVQEEVRKAAAEHTERCATDILRAAADRQVQQTVQDIVPAIAEEHIKTELKRLTRAA